jgi:hypothetical protein
VDPRPLDTVIASALPGNRDFWGVTLDLLRALFIKSVVFFGLPLALTMSPEVKREQDKRAAASDRAKQQARKSGRFSRPRLVDMRAPDDPDPSTPAPPTPANAAIVGALLSEVIWLMTEGNEARYGT